jgi:TRAP-type C4-dicarboxylate transport system permease small subunit
MQALWNAYSALARVLAWIGGGMIMVAALIVSTEVICRKLFAFPFSGSDEVAAYLFAVGTSWSMAFVLITRGHVRIDALYGTFPAALRPWFDLLALLGLGVLVVALADRSWEILYDNYRGWNRSNTPLRFVLAYPQSLWFFGWAFFLAGIALAVVRTFVALLTGDLATVSAVAGVPSQDEEIKGELESLGLPTRGVAAPPSILNEQSKNRHG